MKIKTATTDKITCGIYLFDINKKLLIGHPTKHKSSVWTIPKGRMDKGETSYLSVAKREMYEETNIDLDEFKFHITSINEFDLVRYKATNKYLKAFFIRVNHDFKDHNIYCDSMVIRDGKPAFPEIDAFKWVTIEEAETLLHESQIKNLEYCKNLLK